MIGLVSDGRFKQLNMYKDVDDKYRKCGQFSYTIFFLENLLCMRIFFLLKLINNKKLKSKFAEGWLYFLLYEQVS